LVLATTIKKKIKVVKMIINKFIAFVSSLVVNSPSLGWWFCFVMDASPRSSSFIAIRSFLWSCWQRVKECSVPFSG
jgi:hypothetical protein